MVKTRLRDKVLEGAFWASLEGWGRQFASLVVFVLLARLLTPVEVGLFAMVAIVLAAVQTILDEGLTEVLVQREHLEREHLDSAFWLVVGVSLALCGLTALLADPIAQLFDQPGIAPLIAAASLAPLLAGLSGVHQGLLRRRMDYRLLMVRSMAGVVAGGVAGVAMAWQGFGAWALVAQQVVDRLVGGLVLWCSTDWRPRLSFSWRHARDLMPFSAYLAATRVVNFTSKQVDRYLIGLFMGPAVLGIYNIALRVSDTAYALLAQGLSNIGLNVFARLQKQPAKLREALVTAAELSNLFAMPAFLGLAVVAPNLVAVVFGPAWVEAGPILSVLALLGIPAMFSTFAGALMRALGTTRLLLWLLILSAVTNILVVVGTVGYGLFAVAVGILVRNLCFIPLYLLIQKRLTGVSPLAHLARSAPGLAAAVGMAVVVWWIGGVMAAEGWTVQATLGGQIATGLATYPLLLALVARGSLARLIEALKGYRERTATARA
ncbi:MAG TPA: lipopolysaccharide biosynthesis protein [Azospirillaceae bacterium]|nr:lipopolysaccharide biosynthesis protein [Azospirillaceae bacterium]